VEAVEGGVVPGDFGLLGDLGSAHGARLGGENAPDLAQQLPAVCGPAPTGAQTFSQAFDPVEDPGDPRLVEREHRALGQNVCHHLEPLDADVAQGDLATRGHPLDPLRIDVDLHGFALRLLDGLGHEGADRVEHAPLLVVFNAEEHCRTESEENRVATRTHADGKGRERERFTVQWCETRPFELLQVEASAEQPRPRPKLI
jgi:hypothetical protein